MPYTLHMWQWRTERYALTQRAGYVWIMKYDFAEGTPAQADLLNVSGG